MLRIVAVVFLVLLSGCRQSSFLDNKLDLPPSPESKEEVVFWHTYSEEETRIFENNLLPEFEKQYPDIDITPVRFPFNMRFKSALIAKASSYVIPDVVRMDIVWVPEFAHLGLLYPISDFQDFGQAKQKLQASTLETNAYQGKYYGLPLNMTARIAIYNREKLSSAGFSSPPLTMAELLEAAGANLGALGMEGYQAWTCLPYFLGLGGQLLDETNSRADGYLNSPASVHALEQMREMLNRGILKKSVLSRQEDRWESLMQGNLLMIDEGPWFYRLQAISKSNQENILSKTIPAPFPGKSIVGGENLVLMKNSKHAEAAWTFMKWMTSKEAEQQMFTTGVIPTNSDVDIPEEAANDPFVMAALQGLKNPYLRPAIAGFDSIDEIFTSYAALIIENKLPVQQGLNEAAAKIDALLSEP